jgi:hypothetical protein
MQTVYRTSFTTFGGFFIDLSSARSYLFKLVTEFMASWSEGMILFRVSSHCSLILSACSA